MKCFTSKNITAMTINKHGYIFVVIQDSAGLSNNIQFWILKEGANYELFHCYPFMSFILAEKI